MISMEGVVNIKVSDIEVLKNVEEALHRHLPHAKKEKLSGLLNDFSGVIDRLQAENDKRKRHYQENADYYRNYVSDWKKENPEKQKQYAADHIHKKKSIKAELEKNKQAISAKDSQKKPTKKNEQELS